MKNGIAFCFVIAVVSAFALAACGGGDEGKQQANQGQQESTQQPAQKTQQESTQQAAQRTQQQTTQQQATKTTTPSTAQGGDAASRLIGTWDATSIQGDPVAPGTQTLTFSDDGTLRSTFNDGFSSAENTTQYSVLDDSHIESINPDDGTPIVANYSLEGDTLTLESQGAQGVPATYQRTG